MLLCAIALLVASPARALDEPQVPSVPAIEALEPPHRFLDNTNALLTGLEAGALIGDAVTTRWGLDRYPGLTQEANPLARPFVERGWPGQIVGGLLFVGGELWGRHTLHKSGHHRLERLLPIALAAMEAVIVIHNVRNIRGLERMTGR